MRPRVMQVRPGRRHMPERAACEVELGGERLLLHAERAVIWPAARTLIVADVHLGKEGVFADHGVAVPRGPSEHDLARLGKLVTAYECTRVLVLGDLFHGPAGLDDGLLEALAGWRAARGDVRLLAIAGNHDRPSLRSRSAELVEWCDEGLREGGLEFRHEPAIGSDCFVLAGHVHPARRLAGRRGDRLRMPVFWQREGCLVLPAFGSLTGGYNVRAATGERLWAVGADAVVAL